MESKSSKDILQDYFSDMLKDGKSLSVDMIPSEVESSKTPLKSKAVRSPALTRVLRDSALKAKPVAKVKPIAVVAPIDKTIIESGAQLEQKQKLERLLASARSKLELVPEIVKTSETPVSESEISESDVLEFAVDENVIEEAAIEKEQTCSEIEETVEDVIENQVVEFLEWCDNGRPQWAQERFEVLLFKVSGLTLAVPLIALGQIQQLTEDLTPLFGQAEWFMGLQPSPSGDIRTVNTAMFVMPERYNAAFIDTAKYVVSLNGVSWGLAVDSVNQPISLMVDDVNWRSERSKRPWLAGTVRDHMCALIDIPQMAQMLLDADKAK